MADNEKFGITETDARQLAEKLVAFEATLPPAERALLQALRQRAVGAGEDVEGHILFDPFIGILIDVIDGPDRGGRTNRGSAGAAWGKPAGTQVRVHGGARPTYVAPPARPSGA